LLRAAKSQKRKYRRETTARIAVLTAALVSTLKKRLSLPSTLDQRSADAIEETVFWHLIGILLGPDQGIGSGSGIEWRGKKYVVSAKHNFVLPGRPDVSLQSVRFLRRKSPTIQRATVNEYLAGQPAVQVPEDLRFHRVLLWQKDDLSLIEPDMDDERWARVRFHRIRRKARTPQRGAACILGWPFARTVTLSRQAKALLPQSVWALIECPTNPALRDYDAARHFLFPWDDKIVGVDPRGISGACFWWKRRGEGRVWSPTDAEPIGVCTHYFRERGLLKAVRIEGLIEFLTDVDMNQSITILGRTTN